MKLHELQPNYGSTQTYKQSKWYDKRENIETIKITGLTTIGTEALL